MQPVALFRLDFSQASDASLSIVGMLRRHLLVGPCSICTRDRDSTGQQVFQSLCGVVFQVGSSNQVCRLIHVGFLVDTNLHLKAQVKSLQDIHNVLVKYLCGIVFFLLCLWISASFSTLHLAFLCMSFLIFWIWMWVRQMFNL